MQRPTTKLLSNFLRNFFRCCFGFSAAWLVRCPCCFNAKEFLFLFEFHGKWIHAKQYVNMLFAWGFGKISTGSRTLHIIFNIKYVSALRMSVWRAVVAFFLLRQVTTPSFLAASCSAAFSPFGCCEVKGKNQLICQLKHTCLGQNCCHRLQVVTDIILVNRTANQPTLHGSVADEKLKTFQIYNNFWRCRMSKRNLQHYGNIF